ncbi:MAG TPA: flagellin [Xanthobacteraceae bacterium]|nr:flagellin [Xanthobacteraceae bacterium]
MSEVIFSPGVRQNLRAPQNAASLMQTTQGRLTTGKKINNALDNPTSCFTAAALDARSGELSALLDQMSNGISTIQAANNGLTSITNIIQAMQASVTQARQDSSWQDQSFSVSAAAIGSAALQQLTFSGGAVTGNQSIFLNDTETLNGTGGLGGGTSGTTGTLTIQATDINGGNPVNVAVNAADTEATVIAAINNAVRIPNFAVDDGTDQIKLQDTGGNVVTVSGTAAAALGFGAGNTTSTATAGPAQTADNLVALINSNPNLAGLVKASNNSGQLLITNLSTNTLTITGVSNTAVDGSTGTTSIGGNTVRANLVTSFNQLRNQLDTIANDSSFNGNNLLTGDQLKLVFNETDTSSLTIQSTAPTGINHAVLGIGGGTLTQFQDNIQLDTLLVALHNALITVRNQAAAFGSNLSIVQNRQDFTKQLINTLQSGSDALSPADSNTEGVNMLALQTRQQLSTTALSLANHANQAVLRLFQ